MAQIRFHETNERISDAGEVAKYLEKQGVIYERWDISRLQGNLKEEYALTDEQKQQIIDLFKSEIDALSEKRGYKTSDIVVLSDKTPNLEQLLDMFRKEHHHSEDEVRFIVDGHGIFAIKGPKDGVYFDVELEAGDLISVPNGTRHWFTLMEDRKVKAIRIFTSTEGWAAIYDQPGY
ncbi:1,2-dihydroxy-3-keto-5-methylthiopentene dioxygenase [Effusibacillus lacus]|uniref:Acireductone dioxygenase n=1 Tax=Effusibacillus lacus TaxID=1348429 RepID=A0A292YIA3_9BACL|nr:cupin domain-containing protein [Effusibacillus lacus]TCS74780.1 acireductone dioxygenase apoprotein [Effusibacillus lacus]GAX88591.1 acireductone dioxygenase [Effusibacillus lacus]